MNRDILIEQVEHKILLIRGHKVMLDSDLAELYGVRPIRLREQVRRNRERFPGDFMFQLTQKEAEILVSQNAIPSKKHLGGYFPYVFTQEGIAMLSSVLRSERAIQVNITIMRAFVKLRQMLATHKELVQKLAELERRLEGHDQKIHSIFDAIRQLMIPPEPPRHRIGFHVRESE
ncbi:MAG: ORF6N domain-containing protein [Candidatus Omnitrophica bacterium]|nr:ORF6N domain-containing protein [Candidatus Omnitrophota bacterium]